MVFLFVINDLWIDSILDMFYRWKIDWNVLEIGIDEENVYGCVIKS